VCPVLVLNRQLLKNYVWIWYSAVNFWQAVVIEEKFVGEEFSLMSFCDGTTLVHMPPVQVQS